METGADPEGPEAEGLRALQVQLQGCLPVCAELLFTREVGWQVQLAPVAPLLGLGLSPSHGLGISVSLADEHLQEP